ncbi:MAG: cyclodeaminase/cyclohydrolase family protein [Candidatus Thermoplasmatota archaeon]
MLIEKSIDEFIDEVATEEPTPGGGSVAALSGALGVALSCMVCKLTIGKKKYEEVWEEMRKILDELVPIGERLKKLIDEDTEAYKKVISAYSMPKNNMDREEAIQSALVSATKVPFEVIWQCYRALQLVDIVAEKGNVNSITDAGTSCIMLFSAIRSAASVVKINLSSIKDETFIAKEKEEMEKIFEEAKKLEEKILSNVEKRMK